MAASEKHELPYMGALEAQCQAATWRRIPFQFVLSSVHA